jgi:hypothetical protein
LGNGVYELSEDGKKEYNKIKKKMNTIDIDKLDVLLSGYKRDFKKNIPNELYKWEAVKCFQYNWDIEADNFAEMLERSLSKTENLLDTGFAYPRAMIVKFARLYPNEIQSCFKGLYAETEPIEERINEFKTFMKDQFGVRIEYLEEVRTNPDLDDSGKPISETGDRNDLFFVIHKDDIGKFAVPRLQAGIRWYEDVVSYNGHANLYPKEILEKYEVRW